MWVLGIDCFLFCEGAVTKYLQPSHILTESASALRAWSIVVFQRFHYQFCLANKHKATKDAATANPADADPAQELAGYIVGVVWEFLIRMIKGNEDGVGHP